MRQGKEKYSKLFIKILDVEDASYRWIHLCYIDTHLLNSFFAQNQFPTINEALKSWCKKDLGEERTIMTQQDVKDLKALVKEQYKDRYPDLYRDSPSDRQGWFRVWVTKNMREEVAHGKFSV